MTLLPHTVTSADFFTPGRLLNRDWSKIRKQRLDPYEFARLSFHEHPDEETRSPSSYDALGLIDLTHRLAAMESKVASMEKKIEAVYQLVLMMSQAYYWTPEWQAKEKRADEDIEQGRYKSFDDVEQLIKGLNS